MTSATLDTNESWVSRALLLAWVTIIYNVIEGAVAITFGVSDDSGRYFVQIAASLSIFVKKRSSPAFSLCLDSLTHYSSM